jgi:hypothetical protein
VAGADKLAHVRIPSGADHVSVMLYRARMLYKARILYQARLISAYNTKLSGRGRVAGDRFGRDMPATTKEFSELLEMPRAVDIWRTGGVFAAMPAFLAIGCHAPPSRPAPQFPR